MTPNAGAGVNFISVISNDIQYLYTRFDESEEHENVGVLM